MLVPLNPLVRTGLRPPGECARRCPGVVFHDAHPALDLVAEEVEDLCHRRGRGRRPWPRRVILTIVSSVHFWCQKQSQATTLACPLIGPTVIDCSRLSSAAGTPAVDAVGPATSPMRIA